MVAGNWLPRKTPRWERFEPWVVPAIIILVGLGAFALGRLSVILEPPPIVPERNT